MKKFLSLFLVLSMSMTTWAATSSVPSQAPDVMLQAFYWDSYPSNSANLAYGNTGWQTLLKDSVELGEYFDLVWLPPTANGDGTGYIPRQYSNLNSAFGSEADLRLLIGSLKRRNSRAIADIVINHCGNRYNSCDFWPLDFGTYGKFNPDNTWLTTDDEGNCGGGSHADVGYDGEQNYGAARDWDHQNTNVQAMCRAYLQWMKAQGYDGWRYDYCKGFTHDHINDYNLAAGAYISVMEYWDGNSDVLQSRLNDASWNTMVFDFSTKYNALNDGICAFNYAKCKGAGLPGAGKSKYAVTFVDNHDTFTRNNSEFGGQNNSMSSDLKDRLLQANAFILAMPGIPCVFYPHWVTHKDAIKKMIEARHMTGVHSESVVKDEYAEEGGYQATIVGKNGYIVLQLGNKASGTIDGFTKYASGNGYAIWTYVKETEYYMKNNWGGGSDWTWKKMTAVGDGTYKLENVVFGGTGVNYNTSDSDEGNTWVALADFKGDAISAGDKVTFTLNPTAGTVTAKKVEAGGSGDEPGGGDEPAETMTVYFVNTEGWASVNAYVWKDDDHNYKSWPGSAMTKTDKTANGKEVYSFTFPAEHVNIIFNNGSAQTGNLVWEKDKPYFYVDEWYASLDDIPSGQPVAAKFYITGDSALVVDAGLTKDFAWNPAAIKSVKDTMELDLKADQYYVLKVTMNGTWVGDNNVKGYNELTEKAAGLDDVSNDHNIGFKLSKAGKVQVIYTVKEGETIFKLVGEFVTSGDQPGGGDEPAETMTVYYVNTEGWASVNAYVWKDDDHNYKSWPGSAMTKTDKTANGKEVYSFTFPAEHVNIIFNNGSAQTGNLVWEKDKPYFYVDEWYASLDDIPSGQPVAAKFYITGDSALVVDAGLTKDFAWNPAAIKSVKDTMELDLKADQYYVLKVTMNGTWVGDNNVKGYNELTEKTAGLDDVSDDHNIGFKLSKAGKVQVIYTIKEGETIFKLVGEFVTSGDQPGGGDEPAETMTVYYVNTEGWASVNAYVWKDDDHNYKSWPGSAMTKTDKTANGKEVYSFTFPAEHVNIIFNNGSAQTGNLVWKKDKPYFYVDEWYASLDDIPSGQPVAAKFYITGDSALVVDAGLTKDFAWNPAAIKSVKDTMELDLKADQYYVLKVTMNGTWVGDNNVKGYNELTEKTAGLDDVSDDHNIGFKLSKAEKVQVIYTVKEGETIFKLVGGFVTSGDQPGGGDDPEQPAAKFYITGDSALVVDAGLTKDFAWNPAAIKSVKDTMELDLKADQYYVLKVTMNGTWVGDNNVKGYNELTEKTAGLDDVSDDHNIGFKLSEAGVVKVIYTIKDNNLIFKLEGKFVVSEPVVLENGFYLAGTLNEWTPAAEYLFTVNEANPSEYLLNVTLAAGDEIKVVKVENGTITTWYPAEGGNFVVTDSYAGQKTIYFQETYNENWAAFGGFIYIEPNTATDAEAVPVEGKAVKVLRDGQLLIIRGTRIYSVTGELVR